MQQWWVTVADGGCIEQNRYPNKATNLIAWIYLGLKPPESVGAGLEFRTLVFNSHAETQNNMHPLLNELALSLAVPGAFLYCLAVVLAILGAVFDLLMDKLRSHQPRVLSGGLHKETMS